MTHDAAASSRARARLSSRAGRGEHRVLITAGAAIGVAVLLGLGASYLSLVVEGHLSIKQSDFLAYYAAGRALLHGKIILFDVSALGHLEASITAPLRLKDGGLPYLYPPFFAVALAPLGLLPYTAAFLVWLGCDAVLLAFVLRSLAAFAATSARARLLYAVASLSFLPVFLALTQGQVSILLLAALCGCFLLALRGRDVPAGALLALLLLKPFYLVPFIVLFILWRRWRVLAACAAAACMLLIAPIPLTGWKTLPDYVRLLQSAERWHSLYGFAPQRNQSVRGLMTLLLPASAVTVVWLAVALLGVAGYAWLAQRSHDFDRMFALAVVLALLMSPHVFVHDYTLLILPVAICVRRGAGRSLGLVLGLGYAAVIVGQRLMFDVPVQLGVLAVAVFAGWIVHAALRAGAPVRPALDALKPFTVSRAEVAG